jgi:hypothetical protein
MAVEAPQNLRFFAGDTWTATFVSVNPDGTPVDNTGCSAKMQIRPDFSGPLTLEASTSNGLLALGGTNGEITVTIPAATTSSVAPGYYFYDLKLTFASGVVETAAYGAIQVKPRITV